jgi:signal transduction histidine kinase
MERATIRASVVMAKNLKTALKSSGGDELASIMPDGVLVMDVNGIIRYANKRAAGLLGQTTRDLIGTWFGIPTPANEEVEVELRKVGRRRTLATMTSVRASLSGVPVYIATLRETSDQNRMRQELLLEKAEAEEKSDQKTAFMADLSHEMRTPLNAIVGFSEMMSAEMFGPLGHDKYREYAGISESAASICFA